ncbi:MAG TPA: hypothetical protein PK307_13705, partial [Spirochaetota bacterium]|mgnify:CR=1|nr:hypothetical protein [Spirochaetota bacterium]HOD14005.1 hypothetical protein [Spirochaetota bacterium]HPN13207.1 hypothetical protein [Spirochaetota bacterium]HQL83255.1 hypothetical protein [Spirochaetota bacterium]
MNSRIDVIKSTFIEKKGLIVASAALTFVVMLYFIVWHCSIIAIGSIYSIQDVSGDFLRLTAKYGAASLIYSSAVCISLIVFRRPVVRKFIVGFALFLFFASEFVRMFDWGALYFGGAHVDSNFWAHAFYSDGTVYLTTWLSFGIYASVLAIFALVFAILRKIYLYTDRVDEGARS